MCSCVNTFLCCVHNELAKGLDDGWKGAALEGVTRDSGGGRI